MTTCLPNRLVTPPEIVDAIASACEEGTDLETLEQLAGENKLLERMGASGIAWTDFTNKVRDTFCQYDYVILEGLPVVNGGGPLLFAAQMVGQHFRAYRGGKIVKYFEMSPWTRDLSHTTHEGEFHTDINTEKAPPALTAIQCSRPDPGAPQYGINRVARLEDLLSWIEARGRDDIHQFLTQTTVTMLNDHASSSWTGKIISDGMIRYHPETLRAAARRRDRETEHDQQIEAVASAAIAVSQPFVLGPGDTLLLSNHRTLHYRGACSVVFNQYPLDFASRSIFVLHMTEELGSP